MSDVIAPWLLQSLLASSAALLLVLLLRLPVRRWLGAGTAYGLWCLVPLAIIGVSLPARSVTATPPALSTPLVAMTGAGELEAMPVPLLLLLLGLWIIGALAMAMRLYRRQRDFQRALGCLRRREDGLYQAQHDAGLPALIGVLRPRILVPMDFDARYDEQERELVLLHERLHLRRGDTQANALAAVLRCLYWFNPLMHFCAGRFHRDQEFACDAAVIRRRPRQRQAYGAAMLKTHLIQAALPIGCQWNGYHPLKERIVMLKRPSSSRWVRAVGCGSLLLLGMAGMYSAWAGKPPRAVAELNPAVAAPADSASAPASVVPVELSYATLSPPRYPAEAYGNGQSGEVVLLVDVAADGSVTGVRVEQSEPAGVFDQASLDAASKWKFAPATENGKPVAGRVRVPINFDIAEKR